MKILIVDDQRSGRRVLRQMLSVIPDVAIDEAANVLFIARNMFRQ